MLVSFGPTPCESCGNPQSEPEERSHNVKRNLLALVRRTMDPPAGLIAVPVPKAVLLLSEAEYIRGVKRGKWWKRAQATAKREVAALTPRTPRAPR
jgi:hypothetical protein